MEELIKSVFTAPVSTVLIIAGLAFLFIAAVGRIKGSIDASRNGRILSGVIGVALFLLGLSMQQIAVSTSPPTSTPPAGTPMQTSAVLVASSTASPTTLAQTPTEPGLTPTPTSTSRPAPKPKPANTPVPPTATPFSTFAAEQAFQGGWMYWRQDNRQIYAIYNSGGWETYADTWQEGQPESSCPDRNAPRRGFGKIWCENSSVRQNLGAAIADERGLNVMVQALGRGFKLQTDKVTWLLNSNGSWERQ